MPYFEDFGSDFAFDYGHPMYSGNIPGMHIHPQYEVFFVINEVEQVPQLNGILCPTTTKPSLTIFSPFAMHRVYFPNGSKNERFVFYFGELFMKEFAPFFQKYEDLFRNVFVQYSLSPEIIEQIHPILSQINMHRDDIMFMKFAFMTVFYIVLSQSKPEFALSSTKNMDKMGEIIQYMVEHCCENLTAEKVAEHFFISRSKLNQDFKEHIKIGFHELLVEIKLNQAFYMLRTGNQSIKEISSALGFEQENYFNTFFKRTTGMTPLHYRKTNKPDINKKCIYNANSKIK